MTSIIVLIASQIAIIISVIISSITGVTTVMCSFLLSAGIALLGISGIFFVVIDKPDSLENNAICKPLYYISGCIAAVGLTLSVIYASFIIETGNTDISAQAAMQEMINHMTNQ